MRERGRRVTQRDDARAVALEFAFQHLDDVAAPQAQFVFAFAVKDVRGSESNCEHDSREM